MATALKGTFRLYFYRADGAKRAVAALREATMQLQVEALGVANPDRYGYAYSIPGMATWTGSAEHLQVADDGTTNQVQALLELRKAAFAREILVAHFTDPFGITCAGEATITAFDLGGSFRDAYSGSFALQGRGEPLWGQPPAPTSPAATGGTTSITVTWS